MTTTMEAVYENGKLSLSQPLPLPENSHVQITVETSEVIGLLTRLIPELNQNICSLTRFCKEHAELLQRIKLSGRPLVLWKETGPFALVLDPNSYIAVEQQRQQLVELISRIPQDSTPAQIWPSVGRRFKSLKGDIEHRERLKSKIERLKDREREIEHKSLKPIVGQRHEAEKELEEVEKRIASNSSGSAVADPG